MPWGPGQVPDYAGVILYHLCRHCLKPVWYHEEACDPAFCSLECQRLYAQWFWRRAERGRGAKEEAPPSGGRPLDVCPLEVGDVGLP